MSDNIKNNNTTTNKSLTEGVDFIVSMGFNREETIIALRRANGNVDYAIELLSRGGKYFLSNVFYPTSFVSHK